jgi:CDP-glycerol glycerophosphotransferase (TagB/SpsB family)
VPDGVRVIAQMRTYEDRLLSLSRADRDTAYVQMIQSLHEAAPEARIVVKMHPRERLSEMDYVRSVDPELIVVGEEIATNELLASSDVVVSTTSTTLLHSVVLDRPTISVWFWPGLDYMRRVTDWPAVERVHSPKALTEAVARQLDDPEDRAAWSAKRKAFVDAEYVHDGEGTNRVVELLGRLTRESAGSIAARKT